MAGDRTTTDGRRTPLTRDRVLAAAVALADQHGLAELTIRSLAEVLGVKPMSLYHHVANKEAILDGIVDAVFAEIELPGTGEPWQDAMRRRAVSARDALVRHPWALALMESRTMPGPATLRHHDAVLGVLFAAGFPVELVGHAVALLDAYVYGFALQQTTLPFDEATAPELAAGIMERMAEGEYPHLVRFATERVMQPGYDFAAEFPHGLELVLESIERAAAAFR
jgi:AcrR family transcriptional regulator